MISGRKLIALSIALVVLTLTFGVASSASANDDAVNCYTQRVAGGGPAVHNPLAPNGVVLPVVGQVVGGEDPCADLHQTVVFIGTADLSDGLNFIGTSSGAAGGSFNFNGVCVLVNWDDPTGSTVPGNCNFPPGAATGTYGAPGAAGRNPILGPVGDALAGVPIAGPALAIDPSTQASCFNSSGSGNFFFWANGFDGMGGYYTASYNWNGNLDNLRGNISDPAGFNHDFDAKVVTGADPAAIDGGLFSKQQFTAYNAFDATDAGCLQKTANLGANDYSGATGLNDLLLVGTATWDARTPSVTR